MSGVSVEGLVPIADVARMVGRSIEWLGQVDKWGDMEEVAGNSRLIPKSVNLGHGRGKGRFWKPEEVAVIKMWIEGLREGDLTKYNRMKYGKYK